MPWLLPVISYDILPDYHQTIILWPNQWPPPEINYDLIADHHLITVICYELITNHNQAWQTGIQKNTCRHLPCRHEISTLSDSLKDGLQLRIDESIVWKWSKQRLIIQQSTHTHIYTQLHTHTVTHTHMHTHTHAHTHTHTHTHMHAHTHAYTHTHTHVHACTHAYTHTHTYSHTHTHSHTQSHTHTCISGAD